MYSSKIRRKCSATPAALGTLIRNNSIPSRCRRCLFQPEGVEKQGVGSGPVNAEAEKGTAVEAFGRHVLMVAAAAHCVASFVAVVRSHRDHL